MDIQKLKVRKGELEKRFNDLASAKKLLNNKVGEINTEQVQLQGQFIEINKLINELDPKEKFQVLKGLEHPKGIVHEVGEILELTVSEANGFADGLITKIVEDKK